jgi:hypothetical protein
MSAKHKLNSAHLLGAAIVAGLIGGVTGSLPAFGIAFALLLVAGYNAGDIRP